LILYVKHILAKPSLTRQVILKTRDLEFDFSRDFSWIIQDIDLVKLNWSNQGFNDQIDHVKSDPNPVKSTPMKKLKNDTILIKIIDLDWYDDPQTNGMLLFLESVSKSGLILWSNMDGA
jgi:hypothetical protein